MIGIDGEVVVNGRLEHASPTDTLRQDIINDLLGQASIQPITAIALCNSASNTCITENISASEVSFVAGTEATPSYSLVIRKRITIPVLLSIDTVRIYAGSKLYFTATLSQAVGAVAGTRVDITATIKVSGASSLFVDGANKTSYIAGESMLRAYIAGRLMPNPVPPISGYRVKLRLADGSVQTITPSVSYDSVNNVIVLNASYTPSNDIALTNIYVSYVNTSNAEIVFITIDFPSSDQPTLTGGAGNTIVVKVSPP